MSFLSGFIKLSVVIACAAGSFGGSQAYMAAKAEATPLVVSKSDPIVAKLAEDSGVTGAMGTMSPIYPTNKYTKAQLAGPSVKRPAKVGVRQANKMPMQLSSDRQIAVRQATHMPLQIAYVADRQIAARSGSIFAQVR